jgi:hypothetical protein
MKMNIEKTEGEKGRGQEEKKKKTKAERYEVITAGTTRNIIF